MTARTLRRRLAALLVGAALAVVGCSRLPQDSAPQAFDASVPDSDPLQLSADGPTEGSDARTLIQDFLLACAAGPNDDFATARLFLASASSQTWNPDAQALVYDPNASPVLDVDGDEDADEIHVSVSVPAVASVDERGIMSLASDTRIEQGFALVRENGQWRIDAPSDSFIISQSSFTASYELTNLWFPANTGDALVADPRWYPARRLTGHLLSGLVAGPRESLEGAVTNAVPGGTTIPSQGVEISERTAIVSLNATLPEDENDQRLLAWSVTETLVRATALSNVELTVAGQKIPTDDLPEGPSFSLDTRIVLDETGAALLAGSVSTPLAVDAPVPPSASSPAISPTNTSLVAWRDGDDVVVTRIEEGRDDSTRFTALADSGAPSIDRFGWVWSATPESASDTGILAVSADGSAVQVARASEATGTVSSIRISPDGARALVVRTNEESSGVWLATVQRDDSGGPVSLSAGEQLFGGDLSIIDVTWAGESTILVGYAQEKATLMTIDLGGLPSFRELPEDVEEITAGSSASNTCVVADDGVSCQLGALWQSLSPSIRSARYAG